MSETQITEFEQSGVLVLRGAVRPQAAAEMRERIWTFLAKRGIRPDARDAESRILPSKTSCLSQVTRLLNSSEVSRTYP